uniref:Uncharacterized protein n=1 Tax=Rhizophora mucronata TaxID=61149 RepID=A0A2P2NWX7_RHIMU
MVQGPGTALHSTAQMEAQTAIGSSRRLCRARNLVAASTLVQAMTFEICLLP